MKRLWDQGANSLVDSTVLFVFQWNFWFIHCSVCFLYVSFLWYFFPGVKTDMLIIPSSPFPTGRVSVGSGSTNRSNIVLYYLAHFKLKFKKMSRSWCKGTDHEHAYIPAPNHLNWTREHWVLDKTWFVGSQRNFDSRPTTLCLNWCSYTKM